jgi:hypothetical protein
MTDAVEKLDPVRPAARRDDRVPAVPTPRRAPETVHDRPAPPPPHQRKGTIVDIVA